MNKLLIKYRLFLFWIAGCLIILSRRPGALFSPQLWSEDGFVFFHEALKYGWQSVVLPYAGYIHLVPRTVTNLALQLSETFGQGIILVPLIMSLSAVALNSICAVAVCSSKFNWLGSLSFRILISLFVLLFPNAYELFGNVTNIHWWLGILAFFLLWNMFQTRKIPGRVETIILSIVVLSSPNGLLVLPAIAICYFFINKTKPTYDLFKVFLIFLVTSIQLLLMLESRVPKEADWALFFTNTGHYVFIQLFGQLLMGLSGTLITGVLLLIALLFLSRRLFKKLYFPLAFLFLSVFLTIFGVDSGMLTHERYIFIPTVVIICILLYAFKELLQKKGDKFKIVRIVLFCLVFALISIRIVRNYKISPFVDYSWKTEAAVFDRQGEVFCNFPANPDYWSVGFPSSCDRNTYIPKSLEKIIVNKNNVVSVNDLVLNDSLCTVTGPHPSISYQLPEAPISYCWIDFDRSIEALQPVFVSEAEENFPMLFHAGENNLINFNNPIQTTKMKQVDIYFFNPLRGGSYTLSDSSFVIKQVHFYASPANGK